MADIIQADNGDTNPDTSLSNQENTITEECMSDDSSQTASLEKTIKAEEISTNTKNTDASQKADQNKEDIDVGRGKINELDKFKRRLVRAVARLKVSDKKTEDEIWEELRKETVWDCKSLWVRMRALTIKKLKRLCSVEDKLDMIAKVAHLSVTDWLMFDLVLVHEDVDVIGQEEVGENKEPKILEDLFELVKEYQIENLVGDNLTKAWYELTQKYNVRGRKCSPMLLQRRWYQIKVLVRYNFYNFWFAYRGDARKLTDAKKYKPTDLQMEIAKHFASIVTQPFQSWEELIQEKKVSLPTDFERLHLSKTKKVSLENEPDIVVVEPEVETIDLRIDSDTSEDEFGENLNKTNDKVNVNKLNVENLAIVKTEIIDNISDEEDISALELINIPLSTEATVASNDNTTNNCDTEDYIITDVLHDETLLNETNDDTIQDETNNFSMLDVSNDNTIPDDNNYLSSNDSVSDDTLPYDTVPGDTVPDDSVAITLPGDTISDTTLNDYNSEIITRNVTNVNLSEQNLEIIDKVRDFYENIEQNDLGDKTQDVDIQRDCRHDTESNEYKNVRGHFISDVEDTIDVAEASANDTFLMMPKITSVTSTVEVVDNAKVDTPDEIDAILKEVVGRITKNKFDNVKIPETDTLIITERTEQLSTDKINIDEEIAKVANDITAKQPNPSSSFPDDVRDELCFIGGLELEDDGIEFVDEEHDTMEIEVKIKPEEENNEDNTPKIDLKLLLDPVVYTKKLDDMDVFRFIDYISVKDGRVIDNAIFESKPVDKYSINMENISEECLNEYESDVFSDDTSEYSAHREILSSKSWLFQKPKVLSYNPIQLCKNPDFNTRLNRLTAGFFSSERNRWQLKLCKPLTIDLHKAFEMKLENNSLIVHGFESQNSKTNGAIITSTKSIIESTESIIASKEPIIASTNSIIASTEPLIASTNSITASTETLITSNEQIMASTEQIIDVEKSVLLSTVSYRNVLDMTDKYLPSIPSNKPKDESIRMLTPEAQCSERNKIINLPNYDQIRRVNEKLLIAEVAPIQITAQKPPIKIIKKNQTEVSGQSNKVLNKQEPMLISEMNPGFDVHKPPMSKNANVEKLSYYQRQKLSKAINDKLKKIIKKPAIPAMKFVTPEYVRKECTTDRLLAVDTVERILSVCQGDYGPATKRVQKNEAIKIRKKGPPFKNKNVAKDPPVIDNRNTKNAVVESEKHVIENNGSDVTENKSVENTETKNDESCNTNSKDKETKKVSRKKKQYCCWAREKFMYHNFIIQYVKSRHKCPLHDCKCCCKFALENLVSKKNRVKENKVFPPINLVSDDESEENPKKYISESLKLKARTIGINTEYDPDFAGSLLEASKTPTFELINKNQSTQQLYVVTPDSQNETLSSVYNNIEETTKLIISIDSGIVIDKNLDTEEFSPVVSNVQSLSHTVTQLAPVKANKINNFLDHSVKSKCKTNIIPSPGPHYTRIAPKNTNKVYSLKNMKLVPESLLKFKKLASDNRVYLINDKSSSASPHKPICLGRNKILLCSFKPISDTTMSSKNNDIMKKITSNNIELINAIHKESELILPRGVQLFLLPNQELALSIDPGVQLDSAQLANLPAIMAQVQQQFNAKILEQIKQSFIKQFNSDDVIQLSDDESSVQSNRPKKSVQIEVSKKNQNDELLNDLEMKISFSEINKSDASHTVKCVVGSSSSSPEGLDVIEKSNSTITENAMSVENSNPLLITDSNTDQFICSDDAVMEGELDTCEVIPEQNSNTEQFVHSDDVSMENKLNTGDLAKKTILSDLMEMSGISVEDTSITNVETLSKNQTEVALSFQSHLELLSDSNVSEQSNSVPQKITSPAAPDLNIISSFLELKYAYENNGHFYKMDVETGRIAAINVCIKRQHLQTKPLPKTVIDLTDEQETEQKLISENQENPKSKAEKHVPKIVKPIRLFKSFHPPLIKRSGKSLLMQLTKNNPEFQAKRKTLLRINKRKQELPKDLNSKIIDIEFTETNEYSEKFKKVKNDNNSDSDDEPLALKVKRRKDNSEEEKETNNVEKINGNEDENQKSNGALLEDTGTNESPSISNTISEESQINFMDTNPQLEPVAYNDSSDEDCILGV